MAGEDIRTDTEADAPWEALVREALGRGLYLVVGWMFGEPERVGQVALIDGASWLGRDPRPEARARPLRFIEQRPREDLAAPELSMTRISRRQLRLTPLTEDRVRIENVGKRELFVNGAPTRDAIVRAGDTVMVENSAVFVVEERPLTKAPLHYHTGSGFRFGEADPHGMVGETPGAWRLRDYLGAAASASSHVLLLGETGSGKEVAARVVHGLSARARGPLVARSAATIPGGLLDAELFGCAKNYPNAGAPDRRGLVGAADGGHLFLDEIGELGEGHQAHLLRVLDDGGQYHRLGETRTRVSDFRLIAATNRAAESLKHDFLARFAHRIVVPGLNERRGDIPLLMGELLRRTARETPALLVPFLDGDDGALARTEPRLVDALLRHHYTEHTRELARLLAVSIATSHGGYLRLTPEVERELSGETRTSALPPAGTTEPLARRTRPPPAGQTMKQPAEPPGPSAAELARVLEATSGNVNAAARRLGVSRFTVYRWMKTHGLVKRFGTTESE